MFGKAQLRLLALASLTAMSAECGGGRTALFDLDGGFARSLWGDAGGVGPAQCPTETSLHLIEVTTPVKLDLLFMIDDSGSMEDDQENLGRNFPRLMDELKNLPLGLPDLHVGVVSSDIGDSGVLYASTNCGLDPKRGRFLISESGKNNNFQGDISTVFACLAKLGTGGSGDEQQLATVRMALSGLIPANDGFLRRDAHLAVVYVTDEDDHSRLPGDDFNVAPVEPFVNDMRLLLTQSISISVIAGWPTDGRTPPDARGSGSYETCKSANGEADIAWRMKEFVDGFGPAGKMLSICQDDFSDAMTQIGQLITTTIESALSECR